MTLISGNGITVVVTFLLMLGCGQKEEHTSGEQNSKVGGAVKEAATKEFKIYEGG